MIDATVAVAAAALSHVDQTVIVTSDPHDITPLISRLGTPVRVETV